MGVSRRIWVQGLGAGIGVIALAEPLPTLPQCH